MAEKKVAKKKLREVLTDPMLTRSGPRGLPRDMSARPSWALDSIRKYVEKTEFEPVDGVNADALDVVERGALFSNLFQRIGASRLPTVPTGTGPTIPLAGKVTVTLPKNLPTPQVSKMARLGKFLGPLAKKLPGVNAGVLAYETASLINSPEARQKARDQAEVMSKRGGLFDLGGNLKNMGQGALDPVGTTYAAGDALADTVGTYGGLAYDKLFGPSYGEQKNKAYERIERRRLERMPPEQRAAREKKLARLEANSSSLPVVRSVSSASPGKFNSGSGLKLPKPQLERRRGR